MNQDTEAGMGSSGRLGAGRTIIPINAYDIFGYFVPAIAAVTSVIGFEYLADYTSNSKYKTAFIPLIRDLLPLPDNPQILSSILIGVVIICSLYAIGHVIGSISSLFIDRILVFRGLGYPYERILRPDNQTPRTDQYLRDCLVAWFCYGTIITLAMYVVLFLVFPKVQFFTSSASLISFLIGLFVLLFPLQVILLFETVQVSRGKHLELRNQKYIKALRAYTYCSRILGTLLSKLLHRRRQIPECLLSDFQRHFREEFGISTFDADTCNYWFCEMYVADKAREMHKKLTTWLHLFSFARNLATTFYCVFVYSFLVNVYNFKYFSPVVEDAKGTYLLITFPVFFFLMSFFMLVRYYYLYSCYYSAFLFRAFLYLKRPGASCEQRSTNAVIEKMA